MKTALLFFVLLIPAMIAAQNMKSTDSHSSQSNAKFSAMEDQFVKESLALSPVNASLAFACSYVGLMFLIAYGMHRRGWFVRV